MLLAADKKRGAKSCYRSVTYDLRSIYIRQRRHRIIEVLHIVLHFAAPAVVTGLFFRRRWQLAYLAMISTMVVDVDHLFANPVYDPTRCSIGFHPLHEPWFIALYFVLCFLPKTQLFGIGLMLHMALDAADCQLTNGIWFT